MTTDTAVRVTRMVVHDRGEMSFLSTSTFSSSHPLWTVPLEQISYVDFPEILINEHERTEMPFRYVKDAQNQPIMPDVRKSFLSSTPCENLLTR